MIWKVVISFIIISITNFQCFCQPILNQSNNAPVVGDIYNLNYIYTGNINEGVSGANVTWDFSNLISTGFMQMNWVDPISSINDTSFIEANLAYCDTSINFWKYYQSNTNELLYIGNIYNQNINKFSDFIRELAYPFSYDSYYTDFYSNYMINDIPEDSLLGSINVSGDAYGTLILPFCTISNVLRIKQVYDEIFYQNSQSSIIHSKGELYLWCIEDVHNPILYLYKNTNTNNITGGYYIENIPTLKSEHKTYHKIYPNPAKDYIVIETGLRKGNEMFVEILGINGKTYVQSMVEENGKIDISCLCSGIYFVKLSSDDRTEFCKIIKIN